MEYQQCSEGNAIGIKRAVSLEHIWSRYLNVERPIHMGGKRACGTLETDTLKGSSDASNNWNELYIYILNIGGIGMLIN